jgi:hypothetical protein
MKAQACIDQDRPGSYGKSDLEGGVVGNGQNVVGKFDCWVLGGRLGSALTSFSALIPYSFVTPFFTPFLRALRRVGVEARSGRGSGAQ